jgi:hypothetical protein
VRQSGKNSADIRLVVDALDLCYTKSHVDTFVIISGDSDFSPLVSKLRENAKKVIGVGVKNSTSDLLVANCDEFIFYDDLVREQQRAAAKRESREASVAAKRAADEDKHPKAEMESRKAKAIAIAVETFDALASERGESGKIWASVLKSAIKRRKPDFSESYYGFRAFGNLLDEAQARGLLEVGRDDKSGAFVYRPTVAEAPEPVRAAAAAGAPVVQEEGVAGEAANNKGRKRGKGGRKQGRETAPSVTAPSPGEPVTAIEALPFEPASSEAAPMHEASTYEASVQEAPTHEAPAHEIAKPRRTRKAAAKKAPTPGGNGSKQAVSAEGEPGIEAAAQAKPARTARKSSARAGRSRKSAAASGNEH